MRDGLLYGALRAGRALSLVSATTLVSADPQTAVASIAASEIASAGGAVLAMMPMFGNVLWFVLLFPSAAPVYLETHLFQVRARHRQELRYVCCVLAAVVLCHAIVERLAVAPPGAG